MLQKKPTNRQVRSVAEGGNLNSYAGLLILTSLLLTYWPSSVFDDFTEEAKAQIEEMHHNLSPAI